MKSDGEEGKPVVLSDLTAQRTPHPFTKLPHGHSFETGGSSLLTRLTRRSPATPDCSHSLNKHIHPEHPSSLPLPVEAGLPRLSPPDKLVPQMSFTPR
ncbi:hypothetical protein COCON_G00140230 [Conger conger]|uniref:Uncharacterized protein n=1 Tax=Conger conger TaxID=82655 RepID=A0A9Q1DB44_CONCO|nr:hypothetical protein COCON_G00140230 [Conger conger]